MLIYIQQPLYLILSQLVMLTSTFIRLHFSHSRGKKDCLSPIQLQSINRKNRLKTICKIKNILNLLEIQWKIIDLYMKPIKICRKPFGIGREYPTYVLQAGTFLAGIFFNKKTQKRIFQVSCILQRQSWTAIGYIDAD